MADSPEKRMNRVEHPSRQEKGREESAEDLKEVREVVEGTEVAEFIEGEVSEKASEGKKKVSSGLPSKGAGTAGSQAGTPFAYPNLDLMRIQISTRIKKEIVDLEKEKARILRNPGKFEPFRLNIVVAKIRYLKDALAGLAHATTEGIKTLWEKFVKGLS